MSNETSSGTGKQGDHPRRNRVERIFEAEGHGPSLPFPCDPASGFPLVEAEPVLIELALNFLALPHSVVEYGCGKKASLILWLLTLHGVPVHALKRGLVMEGDMSPEALANDNPARRNDPLLVNNPLYQRADLRQKSLQAMLSDAGIELDPTARTITAKPFRLQHAETVQFVQARSHIFPVVTFWDPQAEKTVDRVLDPTLSREQLFPVPEIRDYLQSASALIFTAPMCARFRLDPAPLTHPQKREISRIGRSDAALDALPGLDEDEHARLIRDLTGAAEGSRGDPLTWSYGNNFRPSSDQAHDEVQARDTGLGDSLRTDMAALRRAREEGAEVAEKRQALEKRTAELKLKRRMKRDAHWSGLQLEPLVHLAAVVAAHLSLRDLATCIENGDEWPSDPTRDGDLERMRGLGLRLRGRLEDLALASANDDGEISACALTPEFNKAAAETIAQMNSAGLTVWIDRVGNLHGLHLSEDESRALAAGELDLRSLTREALCYASHIDTVHDAGKLDGRLGVMAGLEVTRIMHDLRRYFEIDLKTPPTAGHLMVSTFIDEEMTFSGEGVAMPGSSAVSGLSTVEEIHQMTNARGERFRDQLLKTLRFLTKQRREGKIDFQQASESDDDRTLLEIRPDPRLFATRHTYERHIEQGQGLIRADLPLVLVDRIMGIHQEDFHFQGRRSEEAAFEFALRIRERATPSDREEVRVTVGIIAPGEANALSTKGWRWTFTGERNHAGSTCMNDRRDPVVAAARFAREFRRRADHATTIGEAALIPGQNRNVIPEVAALSLAFSGELPESRCDEILKGLKSFVRDTLSRPVPEGGEAIRACDVEQIEKIAQARNTRLSLDLRSSSRKEMTSFLKRVSRILGEIENSFQVAVEGEVQEEVDPLDLAGSGQVLQLERSFGGSHNPGEAQLARDLLRGTMVQLAVTRAFRQHAGPSSLNLHRLTSEHLPEDWRNRVERFVSGALHDTSNVAAGQQKRTSAI